MGNSTKTCYSGETQENIDDVEARIRTLFTSTNNGQLASAKANRKETHWICQNVDTPITQNLVSNRKYGTKKRLRKVMTLINQQKGQVQRTADST